MKESTFPLMLGFAQRLMWEAGGGSGHKAGCKMMGHTWESMVTFLRRDTRV